jgi:haloacetate dehalogenase
MALDHPARVRRVAVLDIIPTGEAFRRADMAFGLGYWHWFFLAQPHPLPENLIGCNPDNYYFRGNRALFAPEALAEYLRCCHDPATIHAMCEDYRAGATIDYQLDQADRGQKRIECPLLALWGEHGVPHAHHDVLEVWRAYADNVSGHVLPTGHFLAEERPDETAEELLAFLSEAQP